MTDPQTAYRETAAGGASSVRLVILLYDQMVRDLRRAIGAIEQNQIEARTAALNHALVVLEQLQGRLNRDAGGRVARNLNQFYNLLRGGLVEAQIKVSRDILTQWITDLLNVREAWIEVERAEADRAGSGSAAGPAAAEFSRAGWQG